MNSYRKVQRSQYHSVIYRKIKVRCNPPMDPREIRRLKLNKVVDDLFEGKRSALAAAIGQQSGFVTRILSEPGTKNAKTIGEKLARSIEEALKLPRMYLDTEGEAAPASELSARPIKVWEAESELPADEYVFLPRLDISASCGTGAIIWHIDEKGQRQAFRRSWAERLGINPLQAATILAQGDSMEPRIIDGDSLVIDYQDKAIQSGKVYVIAFDGEWFIKRLFKTPGGAVNVRSDNPDKTKYPDWTIPPDELRAVDIIGRVVAVSGGI